MRQSLAPLLAAEIRSLLRDRRTVTVSIVLPLLLFPLVLFATTAMQRSRMELLSSGTLTYGVDAAGGDSARTLIEAALRTAGPNGERFAASAIAASAAALRSGEVDVLASVAMHDTSVVPAVVLTFRSDRERSLEAMRALYGVLEVHRDSLQERNAARRGFPVSIAAVVPLEVHDTSTAAERGRALLGLLLTPVLTLLLLSGAAIVAADAIAGEKERGTLETLLTTAVSRSDIVRAKLIAILGVGVAITAINVGNLLLYASLGLFDLPAGLDLAIPPATVALLLVLLLPLAALVAAVLLALSGVAKSYREFQVYVLPVLLAFLLAAAASVLPAVRLRSIVVLAPVANISIAVKEVLAGTTDWPFLALAVAVTGATAAAAVRMTTRVLSTERLVTGAELTREELVGGPALFHRRVLRWFAVLWALLLASTLWVGDAADVRLQVSWNLVVLFLGATLAMLRTYRIDARRALSLRLPAPRVWLAVLIGAPSAYVTGIGVARIASLLFPVPQRIIEAFGQYVLPEGIPLWQVLFFLALLPAVAEEILFRGMLLHGLRPRLRPVALCLAVGAIFGVFHADLFRILPTAYLGTVLATVVVLTGSILPAMLWHAMNNAVALLPAWYGLQPRAPQWWLYGIGVAGLAVAFALLWQSRSRTQQDAPKHTNPPDGAYRNGR